MNGDQKYEHCQCSCPGRKNLFLVPHGPDDLEHRHVDHRD
jgi:hypothetical protein